MISSFTFSCEIPREFNSVLQNTLGKLDFKPTLAFAFVSVDFPLTKIMDSFHSNGIALFGSTCAGTISFDKEEDTILDKGAVFMLTDIAEENFELRLQKFDDLTPSDIGKIAGDLIKKPFDSPSLITAFSGLNLDIQTIINGILKKTGSGMKMFGNLAGDDLRFEKTLVFTEEELTDRGAVFLILDAEKIDLRGMTTSGWNGLGTDFTITRSKSNIVFEIDGEPALDLYAKYLNLSEEELPLFGQEYPLMIRNHNGTVSFRVITDIDKKNQALIFSSYIKQGTVFSFSASPGYEILEKTREAVIKFHEDNQEADLLLLFPAVARNLAIGPLITTEIKLASIKWKVPLTGGFCYGEIASDGKHAPEFYHQSFTLALLTEKPAQDNV